MAPPSRRGFYTASLSLNKALDTELPRARLLGTSAKQARLHHLAAQQPLDALQRYGLWKPVRHADSAVGWRDGRWSRWNEGHGEQGRRERRQDNRSSNEGYFRSRRTCSMNRGTL